MAMTGRGVKRANVGDAFEDDERRGAQHDAKMSRSRDSGAKEKLHDGRTILTPAELQAHPAPVTRVFDAEEMARRHARRKQSHRARKAEEAKRGGVCTNAPSGFVSFCWLCRRRFPTVEALDLHSQHSRLHRDAIRRIAGLS
uniref:Uncharacterized protein n=1 Tax=Noctiluca scintillans TaxID=2966 RepID=A0A7S1FF25_NOCSC|mmetsp:Transcript_59069/g.157192  ORF Transcript_59069/g.157192 Transcript_59069/m.157192 type:complete len:142 (+) Transcript_59069:76-501(+)